MLKKLKILLLAVLMIPCMALIPGCGKNDDSSTNNETETTTPTTPEQVALTTAQKDTAVGYLKTGLSDDHTQKGNTAFAKYEFSEVRDNVTIDFTNSNLPPQLQEMAPQFISSAWFAQYLLGYNSDGTGYLIEKNGVEKDDLVFGSVGYFEKSEDKYINYNIEYDSGEIDTAKAEYVSSDHAKHDVVKGSITFLNEFFGDVHECDTFEEFVETMKSKQLQANGIAPDAEGITISVDITLDESIYTLTGKCTMVNVESDAGIVTGTSDFEVVFNEDTVLSYESILDVTTKGIIMPDIMFKAFGATGEGTFSVDLDLNMVETYTFSETYDNTYMKTDFSDLGIGEITNKLATVKFVDKEGYTWGVSRNVDYTQGVDTDDLILQNNGVDVSGLTWYVDPECNTPFTGIATLKSYDEIILYTNDTVNVPNTHATVRKIFAGEKTVEYINGNASDSYSGYSAVYLTINDGERTLLEDDEKIEIMPGNTYLIEIID